MKKIIISSLVFVALSVSAVSFAGESLVSGSKELKLDFKEPTQTIKKMVRRFIPMSKKMDKTSVGVQTAIEAVKADPNTLNRAKFEKALALHMKPVMSNIDMVLESEHEMKWAIEDVGVEVKRVALRISHDHQRSVKKVESLKVILRKQVKELQKLAAEVQTDGKNVDNAKINKLRRLQQQVKLNESQLKVNLNVALQLKAAMQALSKSADSLSIASQNSKLWFDNLSENRKAFRSLIRARMDMATITQLGSSGAGKNLNEMLKAFNTVVGQIDGVGDILSQVGDSMGSVETFNQDVSFDVTSLNGGAGVDVKSLSESILNTDYSYLNK